MSEYQDFLDSKAICDVPTGIENPGALNASLFPFQSDITRWALRRGRAAVFAGTGLGKTPMQCEAARVIAEHTGGKVLILAPLAVARQTVEEAEKILGLTIQWVAGSAEIKGPGVYITNYQKLHHFDPSDFAGVILDESSCLKAEDAKTRVSLVEGFAETPFRLAFTATPAPNDFMEIGGHAEFLGVMSTSEMLATFFVHDGGETQNWRLKGHAEKDFWKWMASWCVCLQHPRDLGYEDKRYDLPPLQVEEIIVASKAGEWELLPGVARTLQERRGARRGSLDERVRVASELANSLDGQVAVWCNLNDEGDQLEKEINGATQVAGADTDEHKETAMLDFAKGKIRALVTKAKIAGWGMNWQNCRNVIVFPSDSFESYFQLVRRFWRFGQTETVRVWLISAEAEGAILANLKRKEKDAEEMYRELVQHVSEITRQTIKAQGGRTKLEYHPKKTMKLPDWIKSDANPS